MTDTEKTLREALAKDRFAEANGIELVEVRPGCATAQMTVDRQHLNCLDMVHGGALFTLASVAFFAACNAAGNAAVGINLSISYLKPAPTGTLRAEAEEVARSRKLSTCTVRVTDRNGELVAMFHGTAYIKNEPFPPESVP